jgi:hypothetical protein
MLSATPILQLAITTDDSWCPGGREAIDAGFLLADNGKVIVYREYLVMMSAKNHRF